MGVVSPIEGERGTVIGLMGRTLFPFTFPLLPPSPTPAANTTTTTTANEFHVTAISPELWVAPYKDPRAPKTTGKMLEDAVREDGGDGGLGWEVYYHHIPHAFVH